MLGMALRGIVFLVLLLIPLGAQQAFATIIDFDIYPTDGTVPQNLDRITTEWASCNVSEFTTTVPGGPQIWDFAATGKSPPNHISGFGGNPFLQPIGVEFVSPVTSASIVALGVGRCGLALDGFNSNNVLVDSDSVVDFVTGGGSGAFNVDVLSISGSDIVRLNIRQLTVPCAGGVIDGYTIDDLMFPGPVCEFQEESAVVGGELIPIETTSLILAGAQSFSWMIPVILSVVGIGLFVVSKKDKNS